jgi:hypothetical protein
LIDVVAAAALAVSAATVLVDVVAVKVKDFKPLAVATVPAILVAAVMVAVMVQLWWLLQ